MYVQQNHPMFVSKYLLAFKGVVTCALIERLPSTKGCTFDDLTYACEDCVFYYMCVCISMIMCCGCYILHDLVFARAISLESFIE